MDLQGLLYPMFVHLFLEMIYGGHKSAGKFQSKICSIQDLKGFTTHTAGLPNLDRKPVGWIWKKYRHGTYNSVRIKKIKGVIPCPTDNLVVISGCQPKFLVVS